MKPQRTTPSLEPNGSLPTTEARSPSNGSIEKHRTRWQSALSHLKTEINLEHADIPIIACCLVSGLCDSSAYNAWTCFVSMQTGKEIFHPSSIAQIANSKFRKHHLPCPRRLRAACRPPLWLGKVPHLHIFLPTGLLHLREHSTHKSQSTRHPGRILPPPIDLHNCCCSSRSNTCRARASRCCHTKWRYQLHRVNTAGSPCVPIWRTNCHIENSGFQ